MKFAKITTNKGVLTVMLFEEEVPETVDHFCRLAEQDVYKNSKIFKYIKNALLQAGSPTNKPGGWSGFLLKGEGHAAKLQRHDFGVLGMAAIANNMVSTQFYICLGREHTYHMDGFHTCIGQVVREDFGVLKSLERGDDILDVEIIRALEDDDAALRKYSAQKLSDDDY
ncbi:peptidylprolyl isomerase [Algivirga pacifica]|uniref:Peptidyl-prolyl cis-trans isomerase n=1 Tax=Algivirga pacifica TaxID=1162670 RepID=A0ABP9D4N3_9BACT